MVGARPGWENEARRRFHEHINNASRIRITRDGEANKLHLDHEPPNSAAQAWGMQQAGMGWQANMWIKGVGCAGVTAVLAAGGNRAKGMAQKRRNTPIAPLRQFQPASKVLLYFSDHLSIKNLEFQTQGRRSCNRVSMCLRSCNHCFLFFSFSDQDYPWSTSCQEPRALARQGRVSKGIVTIGWRSNLA